MSNKAYKFRIYPNKEQQIQLAKTFGCVRKMYNYYLDKKITAYKTDKKSLSYTQCSNDMSVLKKTKEYTYLSEVDSIALQQSLRHLDTAFQNFFQNVKSGFPKFKSRHNSKASYSTVNINNNIRIENGCIKLPKIQGLVKVVQHREIPKNYKIKSAAISQTQSGKYYVSILCEYENQVQAVEPETFIGLDFSMSELYVTSNNTSAEYPKYFRKAQEKLKRECRQLSRKLVDNYDCICIEDLDMKAMSQCLNFGKSVSDNGWGIFVTFLNYKLENLGKHLVKIDKWFPSSKTCSNCGSVKENLQLSDRIYCCEHCGISINRDYNSSINIKNEGMRIVLA